MSKLLIPDGYKPILSIYETQLAIGSLNRMFEDKLSSVLNLKRVSAPLFVESDSGLNDDLNGIERPVEFDILETNKNAQIVHSLAKWKRMALYDYGFPIGEGLYTDMNAIRRDEEMDNLHSIYVDQWDWEKVISRDDRTEEALKDVVTKIIAALCETHKEIKKLFPVLKGTINEEITFITTQELYDKYPKLNAKERENAIAKEKGTVFIMKIGDKLSNGDRHDGRAPDYDDWSLNGDIIFWCDVLKCALEISSMGIRVDEKALDYQLKQSGCDSRRGFSFHKMLLEGRLPLTIGGGIGQSRTNMLLLEKAHVGEVQVSVWDEETLAMCKKNGIKLL